MGLKEKLQTDLTDAIRARDEVKSGTVRMLLAAITNEEVAGKAAKVLTDAEIITVLSREAKKRREAVDAYTQAKRDDLANKEKAEGQIIAQYLPEQLSEADIKKMISEAIAQTNASGPAGMGSSFSITNSK
jgi:uncharacterized protein YqeY